jgi:hypothetical protein
MISREAISYGLHEARAILASGQAAEAHRQLDRIIENLKFILSPSGRRKNKDTTAADEFGCNNVEALLNHCDKIVAAIVRGDTDLALKVLHDAKQFWDGLPDTRKAHRLGEIIRQLQKARLHAAEGEQQEAKALIDEVRIRIDAMWYADSDKATLRVVRSHTSEAGLAVVMRDFSRSVLALDSAIGALKDGSKHK